MKTLIEALHELREESQEKTKLTKHLDYPDVVKGYLYNAKGFSDYKLCVSFQKRMVGKLPYPFKVNAVHPSWVKSGSRIGFLTETDALKWPDASECYVSLKEDTWVRIDIDGDIPCYATLDWVSKADPSAVHPVIKERLSQKSVANPFASPEILKRQQKWDQTAQQKETFIEEIKAKYEAKEFGTPNGDRVQYELSPKYFSPYLVDNIILLASTTAWELEGWREYEISPEKKVIDLFENLGKNYLSKVSTRTAEQQLNAAFPGYDVDINEYSDDKKFYMNLRKFQALGLWFAVKGAQLNSTQPKITIKVSFSTPRNGRIAYNIHELNDLASQINRIIAEGFKDISAKLENFIQNKMETAVKLVSIKVADIQGNKLPDISIPPLEIKDIQETTDYFLENFSEKLQANDVNGLIEKINSARRKQTWTIPQCLKNFTFLYRYFKEILNIDLLMIANYSTVKLSELFSSYRLPDNAVEFNTIALSLSSKDVEGLNANNSTPLIIFVKEYHVDVKDDVSTFEKLRFDSNSYRTGNGIISLPKSFTQELKIGDTFKMRDERARVVIEFAPVEDDNGELVSPFKIPQADYEKYKYMFVAKK